MVNREDEFQKYVVPYLKEKMPGVWRSTEGTGHMDNIETLEQFCDLYAGIDAFYLTTKKQLIPFAIRVQKYGNRDWSSFTIRCARDNSRAKVEYQELVEAIKSGTALMPKYHLQAYLNDKNEVLAVYICKTEDIIDFINKGYGEMKHTGNNQQGQSAFYVCDVNKLKDKGYKVNIYKPKREINLDTYS